MAKTIAEIQTLCSEMIEHDEELRKAQFAYERMSRLRYTLPEPLASFEWVFPITSTAPYDVLRGMKSALANLDEGLEVHPITVHKATNADDESASSKLLANQWETCLQWNIQRMAKRRQAFRGSVVWSAGLYHEIIGRLIHLPTEFKAKDISEARKKAAFRFGDWAIRLEDVKGVHVYYSDYGPERILSVKIRTARELVEEYGKKASKIAAKIREDDDHATVNYVEFDFVDLEDRAVFATEGEAEANVDSDNPIVLMEPKPWLKFKGKPVPFLPWICVAGGVDVDAAPEHQRKPILYPVYQAEQWAASNIFGTILMSLATAEAAAPTNVFSGPGVKDKEVDYRNPGGRIDLDGSHQQYQRIQRLGLDPAMKEAYAVIEGAIEKATVARILVTGEPSATAGGTFSGYNLQVLQALASLGDYKALAEQFYERLYETMLLISHYTGKDIEGYGESSTKYIIDSEDIDPDAIYLKVELKPDVPVDRVQRITAGVQMSQSLPYSPQRVLKSLGETDPEGALKEWKRWQLDLADFRGRAKAIEMERSGELQQMAMRIAQQIVQEQAAQAPPIPETPGAGNPPNPNNPPGIMGVEGDIFDPSKGMTPPAMASPMGNTFENQRGMTRGGGELA